MTSSLQNYWFFLAKSLTLSITILITFMGIALIIAKNKLKSKEKLKITKLNDKYEQMQDMLQIETLEKGDFKKIKKQAKQDRKAKKADKNNATKLRVFVLRFDGDIKASAVDNLREEVTAILTVANKNDEVLVQLDSAGGMVHGYGLAASQLKRIRDNNIFLTVSVDKVAASGGYMMACVADKILAAPFAIIGSIGVIAQLPNFNRFLKKHDVDFEQVIAGQYKRTLTLFGENTDEGRRKMQQEIDETHILFKNFVAQNRPIVPIDRLSTGETWYGTRAKEIQLIDEIITSDDYLLESSKHKNIFRIEYVIKKSIIEKLGSTIQAALCTH